MEIGEGREDVEESRVSLDNAEDVAQTLYLTYTVI